MSPPSIPAEPEVSREDILEHLERLLATRRFAAAERNAKFLRYVVEQTLAGKASEIKETVIAGEVYGRVGNYDPKTDSIVRVEATRLRQKLRSYYEQEGQSEPLRIHLSAGSYVPKFEALPAASCMPEPSTCPSLPCTDTEPVPAAPARTRSQLAWVAAAGVAAAALLSLQFASASRTDAPQPEAWAAWQEGIALLAQDPHVSIADRGAPPTLVRAIERLEFAVAKDPNNAGAWATLVEAYDYAYPYVGRDPVEDAKRAEAAALRAVALAPQLSAAHHMLALTRFMFRWDFRSAEASYRRALELDGGNVYAAIEYADLLRETGRSKEAAELIRRSRALLPGLPQLASKEGEIHLDLGRPDAAIAAAQAALQLNRTYTRAHLVLGAAEEMKGDHASALSRYEYVLSIDPRDRRALPAYGYLLARTGRQEQALEVARQLESMNATVRNCALQVAVVYAGLGKTDRALEWLERARSTRQVHVPFAAVEYRFRGIHDHPRFRELLNDIGLKPLG